MPTDPDIGGPRREDRELVYAHLQLDDQRIQHIEHMIQESGRRKVASAALTNVRVRHHSIKNAASRVVESHTCELVHAYELELDPDVLGYYVQVPCHRVLRTTQHGRQHVSTAHLDFLVFRKSGIELVECKQTSWLLKQAANDPTWTKENAQWRYAPYQDWADKHGLRFSIWVPPEPVGVYLQNLAACYAMLAVGLGKRELVLVEKVRRLLVRQPATIEALSSSAPGFGQRLALWLLARGLSHGPLKSTPITLEDRFALSLDRMQAEEVDLTRLQASDSANKQLAIDDPVLMASAADMAKARERLARLELIDAGELPQTRRMSQLAKQVRRAMSAGQSPLSACLTRYANSGNRASRLLPQQEQAIETVIRRYWHTGAAMLKKDVAYELELECGRLGVDAGGESRLYKRLRQESPLRRALATGGLRGYQAVRPSSDPRFRSMTPIAYGQVLHIDSSDLDVRCAPDLIRGLPATKAKFYVGIDAATGDTMAHALIFGPARTDGLALLMRECVRRNGMLPRMIHLDRGPENTSRWIEQFCEGRISLRHSPTAASAWNGIAENTIKQVNQQVAHRMPGSTAPDQRGRKVDGRFKSQRTARIAFTSILSAFTEFIYEDFPRTPLADGRTPAEKKAESIAVLGCMGIPCRWNDDLMVQTSLPMRMGRKPDMRRGIRTAEGWFISDELIRAMRTHQPDQVRSDCADPSVLYVFISGKWIKAFHNRVQSMAMLSEQERLFELLWGPINRSEARTRREEISRVRHTRRQLAEFAKPANHIVSPDPDKSPVTDDALPGEIFAHEEDIAPFDEREDY